MNADAFRHLYDYHFSENRKIWDEYVAPLPFETYKQEAAYSHGSVRNQLIHLVNTDEAWFSGLRRVDRPQPIAPTDFDGRPILRARWDNVEQHMRDYLGRLRDEMLDEKPFEDEEDANLY